MKKLNNTKSFKAGHILAGVTGLALCSQLAFGGTIYPMVATFQTCGGNAIEFYGTNGVAIGSNRMFIAYATTNANTDGFNAANPTSPQNGDVMLGAYPLTESGYPGSDGQICGYLARTYTNEVSMPGYLYMAVFDYSYSSYSGSIPDGTDYAILTNAMIDARSSSAAGMPTDYGWVIDSTAAEQGAWVTSLRTGGGSAAGHVDLSTNMVSFRSTYGDNLPAPLTFLLRNTGSAEFAFTNEVTGGWASVTPSTGTLSADGVVTCTVSVLSIQDAGTHTGTCAVSASPADNSPQNVSLSYVVDRGIDTIIFSNEQQFVWNGSPKVVLASSLHTQTVTYTFNGSSVAPSDVGTYVETGIVDSVNWAGTNTVVMYIGPNTAPTLTSMLVTNVTAETALASANISATNGWPVTARGFEYTDNTNGSWTAVSHTGEWGVGTFSDTLSGLSKGTVYWCRGYASNYATNAYTEAYQFMTLTNDATVSLDFLMLLLDSNQ